MKTHKVIEINDELGVILACDLKYKDSADVNYSWNWKDVTCKKCLKVLKGNPY